MATAPAPYPRRLIEVDLPIRQISEHARREKSIRHGDISTLHLWWARRPLAACRAVILASLWPDPADPLCPEVFREAARRELRALRDKRGGHPYEWDDNLQLRRALLAFIADFANWDRSNKPDCLAIGRALVLIAHEVIGIEFGACVLGDGGDQFPGSWFVLPRVRREYDAPCIEYFVRTRLAPRSYVATLEAA
jgi:Protein of unknown function (DUF1156)